MTRENTFGGFGMGRAEELFESLVMGGVAAIDQLIEVRMSEELFLDFKRSADNGAGSALNSGDRATLQKAVSGFGNAEGGIVIWGIDCSRNPTLGDVASTKFPIVRPSRFKSWLEGAGSGLTIPPHKGVRHHAIADTNDTGFVVSLIPKSDHSPHQTIQDQKYYMRAGSSFLPIPHGVLAGMFGRRPEPNVFHQWLMPPGQINSSQNSARLSFELALFNKGPGIAEHLFVNFTIRSAPGPRCQIGFSNPDTALWFGSFNLGRQMSVILKDGFRIPPGSMTIPFSTWMTLEPPFEESLLMSGTCGCSGGPTYPFEIQQSAEVISAAFTLAMAAQRAGRDDAGRTLSDTILKGRGE